MANPILLPELRLMLAENDDQGLTEVTNELHPATVADFTEGLSVEDVWRVLAHAPLAVQADIFSYYSNSKQEELVHEGGRRHMSALLEEMAPDNRVDLLKRLEPSVVEELLPLVAKAERQDIRTLLSFPESSAGALMTTEYASVPAEITAGEAIARLRLQAPNNEMIYYIYVLGPDRHLLGFVSLKTLILAKPSTLVSEIMETDVVSVRVTDDQETVAQKMARYDFLAIPVVDDSGRLVGIVTHDDVIDVVVEEATEDAHRMGAMVPLAAGYLDTPFRELWLKRFTWLSCLFLTGMLTFSVMAYFDDILKKSIVLSLFLPLILATGGNSGSQAATLITRALALGEIEPRTWWRVLKHELLMGLALGGALGVLGLIRGYLVGDTILDTTNRYTLSIVIAVTVSLICVWGTIVGSMLPLVMRRFGADPALASSPFVATLVDVTGITIYFLVASAVIGL
ncbi:MAG: magnesium transporter [Pirellulales bacterium]|nr:magnesium transporter [Pirellulales bacterium]